MRTFPHFDRTSGMIELRKLDSSGNSTLIEELTISDAKRLAKDLNAVVKTTVKDNG